MEPAAKLAPLDFLLSIDGKPVPLLGVDLRGDVFGAHARLVLRQRYKNVESKPVEAIYTFPVPSEASVVGFAMETKERRLEAEVKDRDEAFQMYDDALSAGHGAALLDEERRNVFTASVGNLLPGEETVIEVAFVQALKADEGALRLSIPTLVAPRYMPGTPSGDRTGHGALEPTDRVPDADRISPAASHVDYGLSVDVTFDLGRKVSIESPSHEILVTEEPGEQQRVRLRKDGVSLDRDLVLVAIGAPGVSAGVVADRQDGKDGTFALTLVPDLFDPKRKPASRDVVFVVDISGSMEGTSIEQARTALRLCLRHLAEGDRFQILAFSDKFFEFRPEAVPFTQRTLEEADAFVSKLDADGGTEMLEPLLAAVRHLPPREERDRIIVLLTDGQVGNEAEIVERVAALAQGIRIYAFGIGMNVSELLVNDLARRTRGASEHIHPGERIDDKVTAQLARAIAPRVEGIRVKFDGIDAGELAPSAYADLVDGEPWVLYGRYAEPGHGKVEIRGMLRGERFYLEVPAELPREADRAGLTSLWARARIRDLEEEEAELRWKGPGVNDKRIVALSVEHGVSSKYASFVVVEKRTGERRAQGQPLARPIPVSFPAGRSALAQSHQTRSTHLAGAPMAIAHSPMRSVVAAAPFAKAMSLGAPAPSGMAPRAPMSGSVVHDHFASPPALEPMRRLEPEASRGPAELFEKQLANGLWPGEGDSDADILLATARVLARCVAEKIDTAHPIYGGPLRKAVAEVVRRAPELVRKGTAAREALAALAGAYAIASGNRLRKEIASAIDACGSEEAKSLLADVQKPDRAEALLAELLRDAAE